MAAGEGASCRKWRTTHGWRAARPTAAPVAAPAAGPLVLDLGCPAAGEGGPCGGGGAAKDEEQSRVLSPTRIISPARPRPPSGAALGAAGALPVVQPGVGAAVRCLDDAAALGLLHSNSPDAVSFNVLHPTPPPVWTSPPHLLAGSLPRGGSPADDLRLYQQQPPPLRRRRPGLRAGMVVASISIAAVARVLPAATAAELAEVLRRVQGAVTVLAALGIAAPEPVLAALDRERVWTAADLLRCCDSDLRELGLRMGERNRVRERAAEDVNTHRGTPMGYPLHTPFKVRADDAARGSYGPRTPFFCPPPHAAQGPNPPTGRFSAEDDPDLLRRALHDAENQLAELREENAKLRDRVHSTDQLLERQRQQTEKAEVSHQLAVSELETIRAQRDELKQLALLRAAGPVVMSEPTTTMVADIGATMLSQGAALHPVKASGGELGTFSGANGSAPTAAALGDTIAAEDHSGVRGADSVDSFSTHESGFNECGGQPPGSGGGTTDAVQSQGTLAAGTDTHSVTSRDAYTPAELKPPPGCSAFDRRASRGSTQGPSPAAASPATQQALQAAKSFDILRNDTLSNMCEDIMRIAAGQSPGNTESRPSTPLFEKPLPVWAVWVPAAPGRAERWVGFNGAEIEHQQPQKSDETVQLELPEAVLAELRALAEPPLEPQALLVPTQSVAFGLVVFEAGTVTLARYEDKLHGKGKDDGSSPAPFPPLWLPALADLRDHAYSEDVATTLPVPGMLEHAQSMHGQVSDSDKWRCGQLRDPPINKLIIRCKKAFKGCGLNDPGPVDPDICRAARELLGRPEAEQPHNLPPDLLLKLFDVATEGKGEQIPSGIVAGALAVNYLQWHGRTFVAALEDQRGGRLGIADVEQRTVRQLWRIPRAE
eukprot:TRINITY_DN12687_c0_g1_i2.p1 TRINITY_DN12687_c0_g1~~TRINITY_DN12687_c0_g1_i2.p1  ORF type:complete len:885 (+),score=243.45 TRINITY_DN12687_c0_g1_i2:73-2727(+)